MGIEGFIARRALRNVGVAELLRRSFAATPRVLVAGLPVVVLVLVPIVFAISMLLLGSAQERGADAEPSGFSPLDLAVLGITLASIFWGPALAAPMLTAAVAKSAIRSSFGERVSAMFVLREATTAVLRSLPITLVAGVLLALGHMVCLLPGVILLVVIMPIGAVAAVEGGGIAGAFRRAAALTAGQRLALFGALFVTWTIEGVCAQIALAIHPLLFGLSAGFFAIWRASLAAIAYNDLRIRADGLEVDGVVREIGGRAVIGVENIAEGVTSGRLAAMQKNRKATVLAVILIAGLGLAAALGWPVYKKWQTEKQWKADYEQRAAREGAARKARQANQEPVSSALAPVLPRPTSAGVAEPAEPAEDDATITKRIRAATGVERRKLIGRELPARAARLYGSGAISPIKQLAKVDAEKLDLAILPSLAREVAARKCGNAIEEARNQPENKQSLTFVRACPPKGEKRIVAETKVKGAPLWATVLAVLLELRARDEKTEGDELHQAVMAALLAERIDG